MSTARRAQVASVEKVVTSRSFRVLSPLDGEVLLAYGIAPMNEQRSAAAAAEVRMVVEHVGSANLSARDADLVKRCCASDQVACSQLFNLYYPQLMPICMRYADHADDAQDILQEGFIRIFSKLGSYAGNGHFIGWLKRVMVNTAINHYRQARRERTDVRLDEKPWLCGTISDEEEVQPLMDLSVHDVLVLVQTLSPAYRMVLNLYVMEGWTHEQIAKALHISVGTSKSNLNRARQQLKEKLRGMVPPTEVIGSIHGT